MTGMMAQTGQSRSRRQERARSRRLRAKARSFDELSAKSYDVDIKELDNRRRAPCNNCQKIPDQAWNRCLNCDYFVRCPECFETADQIHPDHRFRRVDLSILMKELQLRHGHPLGDRRIEKVERDCCPTCFDNHPIMFGSRRDDLQLGRESWISSHRFRILDMETSARNGCELCSVIYHGLSELDEILVIRNVWLQWVIRRDHIRVATIEPGDEEDDMWIYYFRANPHQSAPWGTLQPAVELPVNYTAQEYFNKIRSWINTCDHQHVDEHCRQKEGSLPRRVIAINQSTSDCVRLHETNGESGRYLALSHCWGNFSATQATTENLNELKKGTNIAHLPKSFRDVIYVAKILGVPYIWIDSLCIVQNDSVDWQIESSKMGSIFSDAYLVVVAASASNDSEGFLKARPTVYQGISLESRPGSGRKDVILRRNIPHVSRGESRISMTEDRISSRAWCMQETMLARRSIYFHESKVVWECHSSIDCECGRITWKHGLRSPIAEQDPRNLMLCSSAFKRCRWSLQYPIKPLSKFRSTQFTYDVWKFHVVPSFTQKKMTLIRDRLPALSGIASLVAQQCEDEYLAGIWRRDLKLGLLWCVTATYPPDMEYACNQYLGPSFSWASVDQHVVYEIVHAQSPETSERMYGDVRVKLLEAHILLTGANKFGEVCGGHIRVSGHAKRLRLVSDSNGYEIIVGGYDVARKKVRADTRLRGIEVIGENGQHFTSANRSSKRTETEHFAVWIDGLVVANIPPGVCKGGGGSPYDDVHEYALLILGRSAIHADKYQRLGVLFLTFSPEIGPKWFASTQQAEFTII